MGSNDFHQFHLLKEDLCCPVCKQPLSNPGSPLKPKVNKTNNKVGRAKGYAPHLYNQMQADKIRKVALSKFKDHSEIVLAQCGHLFHKFCLRHYCYLYRENRPNLTSNVMCPVCHDHISNMTSQFVDYKAHQGKTTDNDKDFKRTELMHQELSEQKDTFRRKFRRVREAIESGAHNLQIYRSHRKKLKHELRQSEQTGQEKDDLYREIEHADRMLAYMQTHHLKIVRKFISKAKRKPTNAFVHLPRRLAPYLHLIEQDDRLVRNLGEIIVPIQVNHLKSDRRSLLIDILTRVNPVEYIVKEKLANERKEEMNSNDKINANGARNPLGSSMPPVVVKVRKSSVSILSSQSLTQDSIRKIMETVDHHHPLKLMKKAYNKGSKKQRHRLRDNSLSNNVVGNVSASDIKIIYMPKRKMIEQLSEPCRIINESESFLANVPVRKCKSTDAVLMKSRKKQQQQQLRVVAKPDSKCRLKLENKRSCSISRISLEKVNKPPSIEKRVTNVDDDCSAPKTYRIVKHGCVMQRDPEFQETKSIQTSENDLVQEEPGNEIIISPPNQAHLVDNNTTVVNVIKQPSGLPQAVSVLEMIYEDLEEERKSSENLKAGLSRITRWDENQNEVTTGSGGSCTNLMSCRDLGDSFSKTFENFSPRPQFFRVDGRGIPRPESPHTARFRLPTFLDSCGGCGDKPDDPSLMPSCGQPDEENQLEALSPEERYVIVAEQEAAAGKNYGSPRRSSRSHGTPACLGMSRERYQCQVPPDPNHVPCYMKRWQESLPSRKVLKAIPRRFVLANNVFRTPRQVQPPNMDGPSQISPQQTILPPTPRSVRTSPRFGLDSHSETIPLQLPPLSLVPAKRPSTAECRVIENQCPPEGRCPTSIYFTFPQNLDFNNNNNGFKG